MPGDGVRERNKGDRKTSTRSVRHKFGEGLHSQLYGWNGLQGQLLSSGCRRHKHS
jgi:hypothetical protein